MLRLKTTSILENHITVEPPSNKSTKKKKKSLILSSLKKLPMIAFDYYHFENYNESQINC